MNLKTNFSAASLPIVLVISTLMLLSILGVFILYDRNNCEISLSHYKIQQMMNLDSAVLLYCKDSLFINRLSVDSTVQLYENDSHSIVKLSVSKYGLYEIVRVSSDKNKFTKTAVIGSTNTGYDNLTFYVSNKYSPLSITGNSNLEGTIYVPKYGVSYNQMEYQVFTGNEINSTQIKTSNTELPTTINQDNFTFDTAHLSLSKDMCLEDTILLAKSITVKSGFVGTVQLIAKDTVIIESNVILKYPSGIYISKNHENGYIEINKNSIINGYVVIGKSEIESQDRKPNLKMDIKSEIRGIAYINGISQLQGMVTGKVFTDECSLYMNNSTYENTIYNFSVIENNDVIAPILLENSPYERSIIKWLN
ncbi:MAG: hypothetical protein IMY73_04555 [Bacteroidetes bacterium]|nr:hypothetical protein [Bacteroidota bacterium]